MPELIPIVLLGAYLWSKIDQGKQALKAYQAARVIFREKTGKELDDEVRQRLKIKTINKPLFKLPVIAFLKKLLPKAK